jgi:DNA-binding winged helix-turn-helix (wHTH) protein
MRRLKDRLVDWRQRAGGSKICERTIRFDNFVLYPDSGKLYKGAKPIGIQPQPFKVLSLLLLSPGRVVTRSVIQKELWDEDTFVDFELGINHCIQQIRTALGDDTKAPRYVETAPHHGYRFIADVDFQLARRSARLPRGHWWRAMLAYLTLGWHREKQA